MRAIVIGKFGGPDVLEVRDVPAPAPSRDEVRIRVRATAVNRADLLQRLGHYPAPEGVTKDIPGLEYAGEIDALGEEGSTAGVGPALGSRVFGIVAGGAYAEHVVVHRRALARMPEGMAFTDAAAIPEAFITAWDGMIAQGRLALGETVLIHSATSGVGTAAIQLARAMGARVLGTGRSPDKLARARPLGLDEAILVERAAFADEVLARTAGRGADVILDLVGGSYIPEDLACVAPGGRVVIVGMMAGARCELDIGLLMRKRATLQGTILRSRPLEEKIGVHRALDERLAPLFVGGSLRPIVDRVLPLAQAAEAHARMESNASFGKIVLEV